MFQVLEHEADSFDVAEMRQRFVEVTFQIARVLYIFLRVGLVGDLEIERFECARPLLPDEL